MLHGVTCRSCGEEKDVSSFYAGHVRTCGMVGECKECTRSRVRAHRAANDNVRQYDRDRAKLPHRVQSRARITKEWREQNSQAYKAQTAVGNAIRDGKLFRQPCQVCGANDNVHAHHADYSKPLDVEWLCPLHHHRLHATGAEGVNK